TFRELLQGLLKGSDVLRVTAAKDAEQQAELAELDKAYQEFQGAVASILGNLQSLVNAKQAGRKVVDDSEPLLAASQKLADAYEQELGGRTTNFIVLGFLILAAIAVISLIVLVYLGDTRRRAEEAERQRAETERTNQSNQDAILRLMNELGNRAKRHPGGAELDLGHERNPRADPGDLQAHQETGRILSGNRRNRGADLGYYRADERSRAERRDPGGFGGRSRARLHSGGRRSAAACGALSRGDQADRCDRQDHSDGHGGRGLRHGEEHGGRGRR